MRRDAIGCQNHRGQRDGAVRRRVVEQRSAELRTLHTLIADLAVRQPLVLVYRLSTQVRHAVRERDLLPDQQRQGQQQVHQGTL